MINGSSNRAYNLWHRIWLSPGAIIDEINKDKTSHVLLLAAAGGTISSIGAMHYPILVGSFLGIVSLYIFGALTAWSGRLLGGHTGQPTLRAAMAWCSVPVIVATAGYLISLEFLTHLQDGASKRIVLFAISIVLLIASLRSLALIVRVIGSIQGFSVARSITNYTVPLLMLIAVPLFFRSFLFEPFNMTSGSMEPSLHAGDFFWINKMSYGYSYTLPFKPQISGRVWASEPERGDIVVFKPPNDTSTAWIKRVIGLPGDEVQMIRGVVHINGHAVPKIKNGELKMTDSIRGRETTVPSFEETLPNGIKYTVLDADPNGPLDNIGPYKVPPRHYFVMGDNRDNSIDSRMRALGFIPFENLVGRAIGIYF